MTTKDLNFFMTKYAIMLIIDNSVIIRFDPLVSMTKVSGKKLFALFVMLISHFVLIKTPDLVGKSGHWL